MMKGFGEQPGRTRHKDWADKSLQKTTRELKMLREVIEKYKDDLIVLSGSSYGEIASKILKYGEKDSRGYGIVLSRLSEIWI